MRSSRESRSVTRPGYTPAIRRFEVCSIVLFAAACAWTSHRLIPFASEGAWLMVGAAALAYVGSDFTSGLVHWIFDTWGTPQTPFLGRPFIRPFREHHTDEKAITHHDFIETNGNNCFIGTLPLIGALWIPVTHDTWWGVFVVTFLLWLVVFTMFTNQFHKWAHMDVPPRWVQWLQRIHLVLPPGHHAVHHRSPHQRHYAITVGWTNWVLDAIGFYRGLERALSAMTGAVPRRHEGGTAEEDVPVAGYAAPDR